MLYQTKVEFIFYLQFASKQLPCRVFSYLYVHNHAGSSSSQQLVQFEIKLNRTLDL
jgi:hypothetical protein